MRPSANRIIVVIVLGLALCVCTIGIIVVNWFGGTGTNVHSILFVIPTGYRGVFRLVEDPETGHDIVREVVSTENDVAMVQAIIRIPDQGELRLASLRLFEEWYQLRAVYEDGTDIPWGPYADDGEVALREITRSSGGTKCIDWFLIGTKADYESVRNDLLELRVGPLQ